MHASRSTARGAARVQLNMQDPIFENTWSAGLLGEILFVDR